MKKKREVGARTVDVRELEGIVERVRSSLSAEEHEKLRLAVETLAYLTRALESKRISIDRLRRMLFGPSTEKTSRVLGDAVGGLVGAGGPSSDTTEAPGEEAPSTAKRPGHGRNGVADYWGAKKVEVAHASLVPGAHCPTCEQGKVYRLAKPNALLRITGMGPLQALVAELESYRCNACGKVFSADAPPEVGTSKYDETAPAMIGLLRYGCGLPFNRLERLEKNLGVPLPAATQWELVSGASKALEPVHEELIRQAAQGEVLYNDDTGMKVLELMKSSKQEVMAEIQAETDLDADSTADGEVDAQPQAEETAPQRTGVFTSGIVSQVGEHRIALFFTGRRHAGENLEQVLLQRARELSAPIQMCDALSRNTSGEFETIVANCLAHGRRNFVNVTQRFPDECRYVLDALREVYHNDALARDRKMGSNERFVFHQEHSRPVMERLEEWFRLQFEEHRVEPNSSLGDAIFFMQKHWDKLTLFLKKPGAPLDNTICERALKRAIVHRKNSLFYKTENGARVGDLYMTLIHTAELCGADPFDYLVVLQRHHREVAQSPGDWLPWNYRTVLNTAAPATGPPG